MLLKNENTEFVSTVNVRTTKLTVYFQFAIDIVCKGPFTILQALCKCSKDMLNKNTPGVKKVRGQSEAALQIGMCDRKL